MSSNFHKSRKLILLILILSIFLITFYYNANINNEFTVNKYQTKNNQSNTTKVKPKSSFELVKQMGLGWNLGNSLDAMHKEKGFTLNSELFWGNPKTTKNLIDSVKSAGFKSIRIPVSYYNHIDENGDIDPKWLDRIEEVVKWSLNNNLYTIINIHHDTGMNPSLYWIYADTDTFVQSRKDFVNIWRQIANRFSNYDENLIFQSSGEWMNKDRNWDIDKSLDDFKVVHDLNQAFIDVVRQSGNKNKDRYLMLSPFSASAEDEIVRAMFYKPFEDTATDKLIVSVHSYVTDVEVIKKGAKILNKISKDYNIPIVLDELGIPNFMNDKKKMKILKVYIEEATKYNIACFLWDDGYEYVIIDRKKGLPNNLKFLEDMLSIVNSKN